MEAIREIVEIKSHKLQFTLPDNFNEQKVEMILLPIMGIKEYKKQKKLLQFNAIEISTKNFEFNRNELHER